MKRIEAISSAGKSSRVPDIGVAVLLLMIILMLVYNEKEEEGEKQYKMYSLK